MPPASFLKFLTPLTTNKHFQTWAPLVVVLAVFFDWVFPGVANPTGSGHLPYADGTVLFYVQHVAAGIIHFAVPIAMLMTGLDRDGQTAAPAAKALLVNGDAAVVQPADEGKH